MFLVLIQYVKPGDEVLRVRPAHREFLQAHYQAGRLICSGPRTDGKGGVALARGSSRAEVAAVFAEDPYALAGVATHEVVEFEIKSHAPGFEPFLAPPSAGNSTA